MDLRDEYRLGLTAGVALKAAGVIGAAAWIGARGVSPGTVTAAFAWLVSMSAAGELAAWRLVRPRLRRCQSLARRCHRVGLVAVAGAVTVLLLVLGGPEGLLAGIGTTAPQYMPLFIHLGVAPASIVEWARWSAVAFAAACIAIPLVAALAWAFWRGASERERGRLGGGCAAMTCHDLTVALGLPLAFGLAWASGVIAERPVIAPALAFAMLAGLGDVSLMLAAWLPGIATQRSAEESLRLKCNVLMFCGLMAACTLGRLTWHGLGEGLVAVVVGLVVMTVILAVTSWLFWQLNRMPASRAGSRQHDRPQWITHLFVVALFLYPLGWAKETELFSVRQLSDLVWSPRVLLVAVIAGGATVMLYAMQTWLQGIERRNAG